MKTNYNTTNLLHLFFNAIKIYITYLQDARWVRLVDGQLNLISCSIFETNIFHEYHPLIIVHIAMCIFNIAWRASFKSKISCAAVRRSRATIKVDKVLYIVITKLPRPTKNFIVLTRLTCWLMMPTHQKLCFANDRCKNDSLRGASKRRSPPMSNLN